MTWVRVANWVSFGEFLVSQRQNYFSLVWKEKRCFYLNKHPKYVVEAIRNKHVRIRGLKSSLGSLELGGKNEMIMRPIFCTWSYIILSDVPFLRKSFRWSKQKRGGKIWTLKIYYSDEQILESGTSKQRDLLPERIRKSKMLIVFFSFKADRMTHLFWYI